MEFGCGINSDCAGKLVDRFDCPLFGIDARLGNGGRVLREG